MNPWKSKRPTYSKAEITHQLDVISQMQTAVKKARTKDEQDLLQEAVEIAEETLVWMLEENKETQSRK